MADTANTTTLFTKTTKEDRRRFLATISKLSGAQCSAIAFLINNVMKGGAL